MKEPKEIYNEILNSRSIQPLLAPKFDENLASAFYERLTRWINDFQKELSEEFEVGAKVVNFSDRIIIHLENIGYWNPALIKIYGKMENGDPVELIQHVSQINILLIKVKRKDPSKPRIKIGFKQEN